MQPSSQLAAHDGISIVVDGEEESGPDPELGPGCGRGILARPCLRVDLDCGEATTGEVFTDLRNEPKGAARVGPRPWLRRR